MKEMRSLLLLRDFDIEVATLAPICGADAMIFDLRGSLGSEEDDNLRMDALCGMAAASHGDRMLPRIFALIHDLDTEQADRDLEAVVSFGASGIVLPGARTGADVQRLGARLAVLEAQNGLRDGSCEILPLVTQTAASLFGLGSYAGCSPRLKGLAWSAQDFSAALGAQAERLPDGSLSMACQLARSLTLVGARAAGAAPIDTPFTDLQDEQGLRRECEAAFRDGFAGKIALSVAQVGVINEIFSG